ncbi:hypothetical protein L2E82_32572 [Cichorium intybus]|uniref:Uncharacterized protein n=1 Tax=Cichorium intybus TaxID=13427 RepID=A0ACB9BI89_CICIN|nr:hypothetical protein L2E82_32572 [Cichorium intybus]
MGRKWFQRGTIDHFLMKYSHAKCGVTGDESRKERRNERSKRTNDEILKVAIADSKDVLDIEHLEGSSPRIYGTIFPINLKPMTTSEFEAIVLINWSATNYANMNCRNKNIMVLKTEMKWTKIHGSVLICICRDGRVGKQLEENLVLGSLMTVCVIVWNPILFEKKKDKLMHMCID